METSPYVFIFSGSWHIHSMSGKENPAFLRRRYNDEAQEGALPMYMH